uniref:Uncharacterized protein n=1 Tax=Spermophilus dauricus TaxID=99837 RepID=A0A8C9PFY4_SPEDA
MATVQGTDQTTLEAGPAVHLGQSSALRSQLWKEMQEKFLRGEPKVLGVVQILIALINLSLGIIMMSVLVPFYEPHPILFNTAYPVWGSVMVIYVHMGRINYYKEKNIEIMATIIYTYTCRDTISTIMTTEMIKIGPISIPLTSDLIF